MAVDKLFSGFDVTTPTYKEVNGHKITLDVLVPKDLDPGIYPLIVRFHGGFLISGASLFAEWFQPWLIEYALLHKAIIVSPDYRLMPEATGLEILEDLSAAWNWVYNALPAHLGSEIKPDFNKILIEGDSAGGWCAVQSAISQAGKAKAMIAAYPPIDLKIPFFTSAYDRSMVGFPMMPSDIILKHKDTLTKDSICTAASPPDRLDLAFGAIQNGQYVELLGHDPSLFPMERIESASDLPSMFIMHGKDDSAVPYMSSENFVEKMKKLHPDTKVMYHAVPGCEHGLDAKANFETPWLKEGLDFVTPIWLGDNAI
ncbi:hypothetical protein BP6252_03892 [Coleophoma cylindrospora]|uniref:Alpha/beta hydrolase fold-3 domain-containing protein n=1 Tax=Coleophoma cylindrospora TaxID=1849047 RepID=A0A3D8S955_9HELO|nr:hypothetical protein BP6252_03892 [Coleophoma cylindrospora]